MREIKFRAYDKKNKQWITGFDIDEKGFIWHNHFGYPDADIMQYTGYKDKNGKEIYEGDVLKYSIDGYVQTTPFVVENMMDWILIMNDNDEYYRWDNVGIVIGNIYENPELLVSTNNGII